MKEIKLRYVFKKPSGHIIIYHTDICHLEHGDIATFLDRNFISIERDLISRDLFTERHDRNGKEIYEGDVVRDFYGNILQVAWANCWARYMMTYDGETCQYYLEDYHNNKTDRLAGTMEVIGNKHENPELLRR